MTEESLADTKESMRQQCVTVDHQRRSAQQYQCNLYITEKYI